ncbi:MAG TPA: hypothetical protein VFQ36_24245 [Ktedonobacteraceae bacterium]|nr:hypothetical protein [Ktedonobacteraceae bacterium]
MKSVLSQWWQDQGMNADTTGPLDPLMTQEAFEAEADAIMSDLENNWDIEYDTDEWGVEWPRFVRKGAQDEND